MTGKKEAPSGEAIRCGADPGCRLVATNRTSCHVVAGVIGQPYHRIQISECKEVAPGMAGKGAEGAGGAFYAGHGLYEAAPPVQSALMPAHLAIYTGSFDPITFGHLDVLRRARHLFDEIVVAIGRNPDKEALFTSDERVMMVNRIIGDLLAEEPDGAGIRVETYPGLTVDFAREVGACAILRGIRNVTDLASECQLAITNRKVADIETVFMITGEEYAYTSSSLIKQIAALGGSLDGLAAIVPPVVVDALREKRDDPGNPLGLLAKDRLVE